MISRLNKKRLLNFSTALYFLTASFFSLPLLAHHSFAVYDFDIRIEFNGEVNALQFRNPHISMILDHHEENGDISEITFIEGAPANMLVRNGLRPDMISKGTRITVIGSPLRTDPTKFFIQRIILEDGSIFNTIQSRP
jgi:hypothetical protein